MTAPEGPEVAGSGPPRDPGARPAVAEPVRAAEDAAPRRPGSARETGEGAPADVAQPPPARLEDPRPALPAARQAGRAPPRSGDVGAAGATVEAEDDAAGATSRAGARSDSGSWAAARPLEGPAACVPLPQLAVVPGGELGRGGMGVVLAAFDPVLERTVAVKVPLHGDADSERRLLREARLAARLDHPAIVGVLSVGRDPEGRVAAVLPLRSGRSLAECVADGPAGAPVPRLVRALLTVAQAVAAAHARGVVHRDLSPGNVRLGDEGAVWLIDWGLAATVDEAALGGFSGGTPGYIAPEQRDAKPVSPAGDVFSLGALLHLLCTGHPPGAAPRRPRSCPRPLWAIVTRALAPDPAHRYADAHAFALDLARWLDGQAVDAWPEGPLERLARRARRHPRVTAGLVAIGLCFLIGASVAAVRIDVERQRALRATAALRIDAAERALLRDDVQTASRLATEALETGDSPRARGVLAATARVPPVQVEPLGAEGGCEVLDAHGDARLCRTLEGVGLAGADLHLVAEQAALLAGGAWVAVSRERNEVDLVSPSGGRSRSGLAGGAATLRVAPDRSLAVVTTPEVLVLVSATTLREVRPCLPGQAIRFAMPAAAGARVWCAGDELVTVDAGGEVRGRQTVAGASALLRGVNAGDAVDDDTLVVGSAMGQVGVFSLSRAEVLRFASTDLGLVWRVVAAPGGRWVAVEGDRGLGLWLVHAGQLLPLTLDVTGPLDDLRAEGDAVVARRGARRWKLGASERLSVTTNAHGRSALAVHEASRRVAVGDAAGTVEVFSLDGGLISRAPGPVRVIKSLAFSPTGRWLAVGAAGAEGVMVFDTTGGVLQRVPGAWEGHPEVRGRHVVFLGEDLLLVYSWGGGPWAAQWNAQARRFVERPVPEAPADVRGVVVDGASVRSLDVSGRWTRLVQTPDGFERRDEGVALPVPGLVAASPGATAVVTAAGTRLQRDGRSLRDAVSGLEGLALAADGRLALCRRDGVVELRGADDGLVLEVPAFEGRCGRVAFCDANALCAVGWDGRLRVIELPR